MDIDVKKLIEQVLDKIKGNDNLISDFKKNPVQTIEKIIGIDLPDDKMEGIVEAVKAKLLCDEGGNLLGKIGGLFK